MSRRHRGRRHRHPSSSESEYDEESESSPRSRSRSCSESEEEPDSAQQSVSDKVPAKIVLCSEHDEDIQPTTCNVCHHVFKMLKPAHAQALLAKTKAVKQGDIPAKSQRLKRTDQVNPTLTLSDNAMDLSEKVFTMGRFKIPRHFEELTKDYLCTPKGQHELQMANLTQEQVLTVLD